ncbi:MAG: 16S rRNA (uracil(1498)-N(3))-methyltransferase [Nitrospiraceae bacterium]|nr:16S rRNA (uracil(1498)-N(3))-methyltransferase [Nitrospiraceae bacterium]
MPLSHFLIPADIPLKPQTTITLAGQEAHHLLHVRHLGPGDLVNLIDGYGRIAKAKIIWANGGQAGLNIIEVWRQQGDCLPIKLIVALLKGNHMDWVVEKATELGVQSIYPVITEHTVVKLDNKKAGRRLGRWEEIARQALKQCRGGLLPAIYPLVSLKDALKRSPCDGAKVLLWESERLRSLYSAWKNQAKATPITIVVGPEGGLSPKEVLACRDTGFISATMGPRILRSETAAIAAVAALAAYMLSDHLEKI